MCSSLSSLTQHGLLLHRASPTSPHRLLGKPFHPPDVMSKTTSPSSSVRMLHHSTVGSLRVRGRGELHLAVEQVWGSSIRGRGLFSGAWDRTAVSLSLCLMRPYISSPPFTLRSAHGLPYSRFQYLLLSVRVSSAYQRVFMYCGHAFSSIEAIIVLFFQPPYERTIFFI